MKKSYILYIFLMIVFFVIAYLFIDRGINTKSRVIVDYQVSDNTNYRVYLKDNDVYDQDYLGMGNSYVTEMVDYIDLGLDYDILYDDYLSGYYSYGVSATLVAYEDDINNSLWEKEYILLEDKVDTLNRNNINEISIVDSVRIDYDKYRDEINNFIDSYGIEVEGYLLVKFNVLTMVDFNSLDSSVEDNKEVRMIIPLTYNTFKINIVNDNIEIDSYYDFSSKEGVNYLLIVLGLLCLSIGLALLVVVIKDIIDVYKRENRYVRELRKILSQYKDIIINIKKFYNKKKYNLIYVDSFNELMDVYEKVNAPISFREIKKNYEAIFLIIDGENAWIYRMIAEDKK